MEFKCYVMLKFYFSDELNHKIESVMFAMSYLLNDFKLDELELLNDVLLLSEPKL